MPRTKQQRSDFNFDGFPGFDEPRYTLVPDIFFDELAPSLSEAELRVLIYIIRRTYGFKKRDDDISLKQMVEGIVTREGTVLDKGTGLAKSGVALGIKGLLQKGVIVAQRNQSPERGNEPTTYTLRFRADPLSTKWTRGGPRNGQALVHQVDTQETVEQETVLQDTDNSNKFELKTQVFNNGISTFQNSKNESEFLENDESEEGASDDEPEEQGRGGDYQPHTPSRNTSKSFTAVGDVLKGRKIGRGRKSTPRSSKTASTAAPADRPGAKQGRGRSGRPEPPEWLKRRITELSDDLHDVAHVEGNIGQAHNLFLYTGAEERRFEQRLNDAKRLTLKYDIEKRAEGDAGEIFGQRNKMPYFFKVLRDVLGLKDVPASETKPTVLRRKGRGHNVNEQLYSP